MARLTLVVMLFVHPGRQREFEQFEASAARIMPRYGGTVERRIAFPPGDDPSQPHELHLVTFPDRESFERYRGDPGIQALAGLRAAAIRETIVWYGNDGPISFTASDPS